MPGSQEDAWAILYLVIKIHDHYTIIKIQVAILQSRYMVTILSSRYMGPKSVFFNSLYFGPQAQILVRGRVCVQNYCRYILHP